MAREENNHRIDYVELQVSDIGRAKNFYGGAFGWTFKDYGPAYCEFNDGRLTGGFALSDDAKGDQAKRGALVVLYASNLEETQRRVEASGGKIVKPIFSFPGGRRFHFADPDGYELAVWSDA